MGIRDQDVAFVAPHRRAEVLRRIEILNVFLADPSPAAAEAGAAALGIGVPQFSNLVRAWETKRSAAAIPGSGRPRATRRQLTDDQFAVIDEAVGDVGAGGRDRIVDRAVEIGAFRGVAMPSRSTITSHVRAALSGRLRPGSWAADADLAIDHCAVDLPVELEGAVVMPIATLVLDVASASVVGLALSTVGPSAEATARAFLAALEPGDAGVGRKAAAPAVPVRLAFELLPGVAWNALERALMETGFAIAPLPRERPSDALVAADLIGPRKAGVLLRPQLVRRHPLARPARLQKGASAISLEDAELLLRGRWLELPSATSPIRSISSTRRLACSAALERLVAASGDTIS